MKALYRRLLLRYAVETAEKNPALEGNNIFKKVDILKVCNWIAESWKAVSQSTIVNCWKKTGILGADPLPENAQLKEAAESLLELQQLIPKLPMSSDDVLSAKEFIDADPNDPEATEDSIVQCVLQSHGLLPDDDVDETPELEPVISDSIAISHLKQLEYYLLTKECSGRDDIDTLQSLRKALERDLETCKRQSTIEEWFSSETNTNVTCTRVLPAQVTQSEQKDSCDFSTNPRLQPTNRPSLERLLVTIPPPPNLGSQQHQKNNISRFDSFRHSFLNKVKRQSQSVIQADILETLKPKRWVHHETIEQFINGIVGDSASHLPSGHIRFS